MARWPEHGPGPVREPGARVAREVVRATVRLRLHDHAARQGTAIVPEQQQAQEVGGNVRGRSREEKPFERQRRLRRLRRRCQRITAVTADGSSGPSSVPSTGMTDARNPSASAEVESAWFRSAIQPTSRCPRVRPSA